MDIEKLRASIQWRQEGNNTVITLLNLEECHWLISEHDRLTAVIAKLSEESVCHGDQCKLDEIAALRNRCEETEKEQDDAIEKRDAWIKIAGDNGAKLKRLADSALVALAGAVCTPAEGYVLAPHCLPANIIELRNMHAAAESRADRLQAEVERLRMALIATGRNLGAGLADDVSNDFLLMVADEALAFRKKSEAEVERLREALERVSSTLGIGFSLQEREALGVIDAALEGKWTSTEEG